jgi:hypothetical protein
VQYIVDLREGVKLRHGFNQLVLPGCTLRLKPMLPSPLAGLCMKGEAVSS